MLSENKGVADKPIQGCWVPGDMSQREEVSQDGKGGDKAAPVKSLTHWSEQS